MKISSPAAYQLLHKGSIALAEVEATGFRIDKWYIEKEAAAAEIAAKVLDRQVKEDAELYRAWKRRFGQGSKITAGGQLAAALKDLGYKFSGKLTEKGQEKQDKNEFAAIDRDSVRAFSRAKTLRQTVANTFAPLLREAVKHADGHWYVHPNYGLHVASTYRPNCRDPNLMNVPKRDEEKMKMARRAFLPLPGHHLVEPDFTTHEVKISHAYNKDPVLKRYLLDPKSDMHLDTAADMFLLPVEYLREHAKDAKKTLRHSAKNQFVFAEFFGSVWFNCAPQIWESMMLGAWKTPGKSDLLLVDHLKAKGIESLGDPGEREPAAGTYLHHLRGVEKRLWERFKVYAQWKRDYFAEYQRRGFFEMKTGFVISTPHGRNDVVNYPIQGSAFHCCLQCVIWLVDYFRRKKMRSRVLGQVYDCIILSAHPKELQDVLNLCRYVMTVKLPREWEWITIPPESETDVAPKGAPWSELKTWDEIDGTWKLKV